MRVAAAASAVMDRDSASVNATVTVAMHPDRKRSRSHELDAVEHVKKKMKTKVEGDCAMLRLEPGALAFHTMRASEIAVRVHYDRLYMSCRVWS